VHGGDVDVFITEGPCHNTSKCQNGGTCRTHAAHHGFICDCPPEFTGNHCETREYKE